MAMDWILRIKDEFVVAYYYLSADPFIFPYCLIAIFLFYILVSSIAFIFTRNSNAYYWPAYVAGFLVEGSIFLFEWMEDLIISIDNVEEPENENFY